MAMLYIIMACVCVCVCVSAKMNTQDIPELMVAVLCMELLNFVYAQNAMPNALKTTTGKFPFSLFFDVLLYFVYIE